MGVVSTDMRGGKMGGEDGGEEKRNTIEGRERVKKTRGFFFPFHKS